ncbi:Ap1g1 [Symbiodinium sp. CCMP2592]|nr:Ap1g1 [Symbiodinium sp. CCMP2592]
MPSEDLERESQERDSGEEADSLLPDLRALVLSRSPRAALGYKVAAFHCQGESGLLSCSLILIAEVDGQLLVAVPHHAWHRVTKRCYLPRAALLKPCHAEVLAADPADRGCSHGHFKVRVWMGLLNPDYEEFVVAKDEDESGERAFTVSGSEQPILPFGPSLASIARDHFGFVSAAEEQSEDIASRVRGLENAIQGLQGGLDALLKEVSNRNAADPPPPQAPEPQAKLAAKPKSLPVGPAASGLDPAVLAAARGAGVPEDQLRLMQQLAAKPVKLGDGARKVKTVLSESEEEEDAADAGGQPEAASVAESIHKMTQILSRLSKPRASGSLEDLLDRGEEVGLSSSSSGGSSKAAAYLKLARLLKEDPAKTSSSILRLMTEDFQGHTAAPGLEDLPMTSRAWLEHTSRVQQFAGPVRWGWQTAGALDALLAGREEECKARLCLMLAAPDQSSLDSGSWLLAAEMLPEPSPPFSSFSRHRPPEPGESHQTKVMDPRWISVLMHRIKERESFIEARKKLSAPRGQPSTSSDPDKEKPEKPGKGRARGEAPK